jgi:outer membrane receptor for ferrienterochelin and colicin
MEAEEEKKDSLKSGQDLTLGLNYQYDEYDEKLNDTLFYRKESVPGIFGEFSICTGKINIMGGFRVDFHNLYGTFYTPRLHVRYAFTQTTILRVSAGKGTRVANILAENTGILGSSRKLVFTEELRPEEAWNYGINGSTDFTIDGVYITWNTEFYRTDFQNQIIVDMEHNPQYVHFYNLSGKSFSNSFQTDANIKLFEGFNMIVAYRFNDVKITYKNGIFVEKPLISKHKAFMNISYAWDFDDWKADFTTVYNGKGRLPMTSTNPEEYRLGTEYPGHFQLHGQISRQFRYFALYAGVENLLDYRQPNPILAYDDPFGRKTGKSYFDSSIIWGPILGRVIYLGVRMEVF